MSSTDRSLILGAYTNLPTRYLEPFVSSLRVTGFEGTLCIVSGSYRGDQRTRLEELADEVIDVDAEYDELRLTRPVLARLRGTRGLRRSYPHAFEAAVRAGRRWKSLEYRLEGLQSLRYGHYERVIRSREPAPDSVMITDLRDVYFQRDPFSDPVHGIEVYLEDASVSIGADDFNTRWIREVFGPSELEHLRGRPVSCSGTVVGTRDAMLAYVTEMAAEIHRHRRPMGARDQAVHNVLLQRDRLPSPAVIANEHGRVLTMGKMPAYRTNADGRVENADGSIPAVLHQWDRHADLVAQIEGRRHS
jgi:hypothetical protein